MNIPIKTDGRIYLNLEIDQKTAYNILCRECIENGKFPFENDGASEAMINSLTTIRDKYSKAFGSNGKDVLLPVRGFFDSEASSFFITSNEVIKGLFHLFKGHDMNVIGADEKGIWELLWNGDRVLLYKGQDARDVYDAMDYIKNRYDEFVQENNKSVGQIRR